MGVIAKVWVLDTDTKGTGAEMVPLEKALEKPGSTAAAPRVAPRPKPPAPTPPEPGRPSRFRVLDVVSREVLAEDLSARETVDLLRGVRSIVDVRIYARHRRCRLASAHPDGGEAALEIPGEAAGSGE